MMRGKHGGYQASRSNGTGFLRNKESRQHLLSPPESPRGHKDDFMPLDLGHVDFENGREEKELEENPRASSVSGGFSISSSVFSNSAKKTGSVVSGTSSFGGRKTILSARVVAKMKSRRHPTGNTGNTDPTTHSLTPKSQSHKRESNLHIRINTEDDDSKSHVTSSSSTHPLSPPHHDSPTKHDPYVTPTPKASVKANHPSSAGFVVVPSDNGIETPVMKGAGGPAAAAAAAAMKQQQQWQKMNPMQSQSKEKKINQPQPWQNRNTFQSQQEKNNIIRSHPTNHTDKHTTPLSTPIHSNIHNHNVVSPSLSPPDKENPISTEKRPTSRGRGKVSRLAKMFSSRAHISTEQTPFKKTLKIDTQTPLKQSPLKQTQVDTKTPLKQTQVDIRTTPKWPKSKPLPSSPPRSTASSTSASYMAWPGTQDGQGRTITMPKDDDTFSRATGTFSESAKPSQAQAQALEDWMKEEEDSNDSDDSESSEENPADRYLAAVVKEAAKSPIQSVTPKPISPTLSRTHAPIVSPHNNYPNRTNPQLSKTPTSPPPNEGGTINIQNLFQTPNPNMKHRNGSREDLTSKHAWEPHSNANVTANNNKNKNNNNITNTTREYRYSSNPHPPYPKQINIIPNDPPPPISKIPTGIDLSGSELRVRSSGRDIKWKEDSPSFRRQTPMIQPLSEAALAAQDQLTPLPRPINGIRIKGYRGFIDKTGDIPNLMDDDSVTVASSSVAPSYFEPAQVQVQVQVQAPQTPQMYNDLDDLPLPSMEADSDVFDGIVATPRKKSPSESESDIFDGLSNVDSFSIPIRKQYAPGPSHSGPPELPKRKAHTTGKSCKSLKSSKSPNSIVNVGKGLSAFQASQDDLRKRVTAKEFDANLTETETETDSSKPPASRISPDLPQKSRSKGILFPHYGINPTLFSETPPRPKMDLSPYYIQPNVIRKLVRKFRKLCHMASSDPTIDDAKKAFALFEMRSRVMETDMERGLERRGGTVYVDDLVLTPTHLAALRVRDIVIVSKAWRDGASPRDVITAASLTRRESHTFYIKRLNRKSHSCSESMSSYGSNLSKSSLSKSFYLEEVRWMDDTDFVRMRCPSLGPRHLRGFEMFTIGDCQSMLLKLTKEQCTNLQEELDHAKSRQIHAEELMNNETNDPFTHESMTETEIAYLSAMAEVKAKSNQLAIAEKSHELVRNRMEMLVTRYQKLLLAIEKAPAEESESSFGSGDYESDSDREKDILARRAQRAELQAEVAAREAMIAKEEAERIQIQKQMELEHLQKRLQELETKSMLEREEFERRLDLERQSASAAHSHISHKETQAVLNAPSSKSDFSKQGSKERVKAKFRNRYAERLKNGANGAQVMRRPTSGSIHSEAMASHNSLPKTDIANQFNRNKLRFSEEEMFQHVEFYERSLKAAGKG